MGVGVAGIPSWGLSAWAVADILLVPRIVILLQEVLVGRT
jgi:hypothetical protein